MKALCNRVVVVLVTVLVVMSLCTSAVYGGRPIRGNNANSVTASTNHHNDNNNHDRFLQQQENDKEAEVVEEEEEQVGGEPTKDSMVEDEMVEEEENNKNDEEEEEVAVDDKEAEVEEEDDDLMDDTPMSILDIVAESRDFSTLLRALEAADLISVLGNVGNGTSTFEPVTVWAPTNDAFDEAEIDFLFESEWSKHLQSVLLYHVTAGSFESSDLKVGQTIETFLDNNQLNVTSIEPLQINNGVFVSSPNITARNGIIHVIDSVLLPEFVEFNVVELMEVASDQFSTLVELIELAGLNQTLSRGVFTVFAPTNEAVSTFLLLLQLNLLMVHLFLITRTLHVFFHFSSFSNKKFAKLPQEDYDSLLDPENIDILRDILMYHVSPGLAYADGVQVGDQASTVQGSPLEVTSTEGGMVLMGSTNVVAADILASNGVIHAIDTVLIPPDVEEVADDESPATAAEEGDEEGDATEANDNNTTTTAIGALDLARWVFLGENYSTLNGLLETTGLTEALSGDGPLTLMAPNNAAFEALPDVAKYAEPEWYAHLYDILLYHIVPGAVLSEDLSQGMEALTAVGENITITSISPVTINENSVVVDPDNELTNGVAHGVDAVLLPPSATFKIVDIVDSSPFFRQLLDLVVAAGLGDVLGGSGPFTLFAPTNNAVGRLDEETIAFLTSEEGIPELQRLLQYHIVPGIILSDDVADGQMFTTLEGQMLTLTEAGDETYMINDAQILDRDILASNGVIHGKFVV